MKVLYVEDDPDFRASFAELLRNRWAGAEVVTVDDYESAAEVLRTRQYSVIVLDLAIPRVHGGAELIEVGEELYRFIEQEAAGTPVLFLTGQSSERVTDELRDAPRRVRFLGGPERAIVTVRRKDRIERAVELLDGIEAAERKVAGITLTDFDRRPLVDVPEDARRLIKAFCEFRGCGIGRVRRLAGGMSGSSVFRVDIVSPDGSVVQRGILKVDKVASAEREAHRYEAFVTRLGAGYPTLIPGDLVGGGSKRALCYNLAGGNFERNFFSFCDDAGRLVQDLRAKLEIWYAAATRASTSVGELIMEVAGNKGLDEARNAGLAEELAKVLDVRFEHSVCVQHGDLHGENILCDDAGSAICLIDFADVRTTSSILDAVTLELSPLFHPAISATAPMAAIRGAEVDWFDDQAVRELPRTEWVSHTRPWIRSTALSHVVFAANVLAYAVRQLRYPDTDKVFAAKLITQAVQQILNR